MAAVGVSLWMFIPQVAMESCRFALTGGGCSRRVSGVCIPGDCLVVRHSFPLTRRWSVREGPHSALLGPAHTARTNPIWTGAWQAAGGPLQVCSTAKHEAPKPRAL